MKLIQQIKSLGRLTRFGTDWYQQQGILWATHSHLTLAIYAPVTGSGEKQAVFTVGWRRLKSFQTCASLQRLLSLSTCSYNRRQNCSETVLEWGNFREQNNPLPTPSPLHSKLGCLAFQRQLEQPHNIAWREQGRKSFILPFWSWKNISKVLQGQVPPLICC